MSVYKIPLSNSPGLTRTLLGDVSVILRTYYNASARYWALDILDEESNVMLAGIPMLPYFNLLAPYAEMSRTLGRLYIDEASAGDHLVEENLGTSVQLLWSPSA